jgi:hypothetical protein
VVEESEIFYGFCKYFSSLGISNAPTPSTWKYRVYYFFDLLGRMLGYEVLTEDTFKKADGVKELVGKRLDMTWMSPISRDYAFALEYENTKRIDDEISKLACITGLRVLVIFRYFKDAEIMEKIRQTQEKYGPQESNFLVLILPEYFKWDEPFEKLRALLFDPKGRVIGFGSAEGYIGANEICAFKDVSWTGRAA